MRFSDNSPEEKFTQIILAIDHSLKLERVDSTPTSEVILGDHYPVELCNSPWSPKGHSHGFEWLTFLLFNINRPSHLWNMAISNLTLKIHVLTFKIDGQGYGQCQTWWSHLWAGVQSIHLLFISWQSEHFGLYIMNSTFDLENWRSRSWPRSNSMVIFEA